ncbi:MAG: cobyrinate a,c-diamide synthase [Planctomycetes bacterium]|nr:cobyrinate a,c-diamide synthase [Planctomycetota bacterium]
MPVRRLILAGTHSGVGKTTVALALMVALRQRGLTVQPFKVGPDFIDPGHHTAVCGRTSRNLDTWMLSESTVRQTFSRAAEGADIALVEGVMGLFDGRGPEDARGSTADIARLLEAPVVLVVDASAAAGSIAAVVKGFHEFDPDVQVAGVVCNRVAGTRHYEYLEPAIRRHTPVVPLGWLPRRPEWTIPERHLGLTTADDLAADRDRWEQLGHGLEQTVEVDRLLTLAERSEHRGERHDESTAGAALLPAAPSFPHPGRTSRPRIAVARDAAFCFYYPENLELLAAAGGEILPFSPLTDRALPEDTVLVYLGGGYPELHAQKLAANQALRHHLQRFHHQGGAIYAECGGLMYACRELVDASGQVFPMLDLLPARTIMQPRLAALGYVTLRTMRPSLLGPAGTLARGHEFHYSRLEALGPLSPAAELDSGRGAPHPDGFLSGNLLAGYAHLHFGSNPALAAALCTTGCQPSDVNLFVQ